MGGAHPTWLSAGIEAYRKSRGRAAGSSTKEQVAIRLDRAVLDAFRATGKGWQTRMNEALKGWLKAEGTRCLKLWLREWHTIRTVRYRHAARCSRLDRCDSLCGRQ